MTWILPLGESLQMEELSSPMRIRRALGGGTQGQVFAVEVDGETLALKWYLPACLARDPQLARRLSDSIRATAPNQDFLWPIALLHPTAASRAQIRFKYGLIQDAINAASDPEEIKAALGGAS